MNDDIKDLENSLFRRFPNSQEQPESEESWDNESRFHELSKSKNFLEIANGINMSPEQLGNIFDQLTEREYKIICYRLGLLDGLFRSHEEVAKKFGITKIELIVALEERAAKKITYLINIIQQQRSV